MHLWHIIGKLGSNYIWRYFGFYIDKNFNCKHELLFWIFSSGLQIMQIWSIIYSLHFENVKIHKHCLYWKVFSTNIYRKIYFNSLLVFSYICWSVNCMSWVSKLNNFFLTCRETEARFIFEGFNIVLYRKFISDSRILFLFFYLVCKLFKHFVSQ